MQLIFNLEPNLTSIQTDATHTNAPSVLWNSGQSNYTNIPEEGPRKTENEK